MRKHVLLAGLLSLYVSAAASASSLTIEGPASTTLGESFQLELWGDFSGVGLFGGGIGFAWDASVVQLDNIELTLPVDPTFSCPGSNNCPWTGLDNAPIVWGQFDSILIDPADPAPVLMATLAFTAIGVSDSTNFSMFGINDLVGGWLDANFNLIANPDLGDFSMPVVVPVPAAVWFMLSGLGALLGLRGSGVPPRSK